MPDEFIFVYGTLRPALATPAHTLMIRHCQFHGQGSLCGHLYQVDGYPGVIETPHCSRRVLGELYRILNKDALFLLLDDYEQCSAKYPTPHEYVRRQANITAPDETLCKAWVYIYNRAVTELMRIYSGDYVSHMRDLRKIRYNTAG